jgi:amino acid adenylation domain-containing protein
MGNALRIPMQLADVEQSIADRFEAVVRDGPGRIAVIDHHGEHSYEELNRRANRIARAILAQAGAEPTRVALYLEKSFECLAAILGTLKAGCTYVPIDPAFPRERNLYIVGSSDAALVLTNAAHASSLAELRGGAAGILELEAIADEGDEGNLGVKVHPDAPAYIIYTSGSTGQPKGVVQDHRGALHGCMRRSALQEICDRDRMTLFYSCSVMGSVYCIFGALLSGAALLPYDLRDAGLSDLAGWLGAHRVSIYHSVASVFRQFAAACPGPIARSAVRLVIFGGERVLAADVDAARRIFSPQIRFFTGLGSTETGTIRHFLIRPETILSDRVVPIGYPVEGVDVVLVDADGAAVPEGEIGEIEVRSPYLALGYWKDEAATRKAFGEVPGQPGVRRYRMGDLAQFRPDGLLQHCGRKDFQVKIRGFRVELGEVESVLQSWPCLAEGLVRALEVGDETQLVAYLVAKRAAEVVPLSVHELRGYLRGKLPSHMVPSLYVGLSEIPRTPNGKVDRAALPLPLPSNQLPEELALPPQGRTEQVLVQICSALLGHAEPGVNQSFFDIGGDSLSATQLVARVAERLGVALPMRTVFAAPDLRSLAAAIDAGAPADRGGVEAGRRQLTRASREDRSPATPAQRRMWLIDQLHSGSAAYHISNAVRLRGPLQVAALERALAEMIVRHETLRTVFPARGDELRQEVLPPAPFQLRVSDLREVPEAERGPRAEARVRECLGRSHDLARGPLFQCELLAFSDSDHVLSLIFNHIIYDNIWSSRIFFRELGELYEHYCNHGADAPGSPLVPLPFQFADYAEWERRRVADADFSAQLDYWRERLAAPAAPLTLLSPRARPAKSSFKGGQLRFALPAHLHLELVRLSRSQGATTFMTLLALWQLLLQRYSGQSDILVGTPTGRRYLPQAEGMIGLFINNLVMRARVDEAMSFRDLLAQVRESAIDAFSHDEVPFEVLVAELRPPRTPGASAYFQHYFIHRNATHSAWSLPGLQLDPLHVHSGGAKFDLCLSVLEDEHQLCATLEFSSDLFDPEAAERIAANYVQLVDSAIESPDLPVSRLEIVSRAERALLVETWNPPPSPYPAEHCTHQLFEEVVRAQPDAIAVITDAETLCYAELDQRANQLAVELVARGAGPGALVGVCLRRSAELIVSLLAVMKSGAAYVPLDPEFPAERLRYMLEDSGTQLCICERAVCERIRVPGMQLVLVEEYARRPGGSGAALRPSRGHPQDLVYVIYTSGSTGKPKGVQISHRALVNVLWSMKREPGMGPGDVLQSLTTICFDIAALELYLPLIAGAKVVISSRETSLSPEALLASVRRHSVTWMQATPITWRMLLEHGWRGEPHMKILCGGEAMGPDLAERLIATGCEIWNVYGPTETTIWSTAGSVQRKRDASLVGTPIANTQLYVMSSALRLQPIAVPGELLIGGDGLARGYLNRPELTAEGFVDGALRPAERLYRTGDWVVRHADGSIEFKGRIDNQVKIRGYRIELGEIEAQLSEHPAVAQSAAAAREDTPGEKRIVAYVVPRGEAGADAGALREHLRSRLPEYMVPAVFAVLESMPLTPNGKVDRKRLPPPRGLAPSADSRELAAAGGDTAAQLVKIFEAALKIPVSSTHESFFDLGGHSITALSAVRAINAHFGLDLPPTVLFELPTIDELSRALDELKRRGGRTAHVLLERSLSAAEMEQVDAILDAVRTAPHAAPSGSVPMMRESALGKYVLARLYRIGPRSVRRLVTRAILRLEGGSTFTVTLRKLFKECHDIEIGEFTSCAFDVDRLRRTTRIGKFCSIHRTSLFQNADHPRNTLATHGMFYHSAFGFTPGYELARVQIEVGNDVWIGDGAKLLHPTRRIGDGAIIAAGAVVVADVPPYAIVAGYPAQVVRYRFSQETIAKLLALRWWERPLAELQGVREAFMKPLEGDRIR